ncbi:MAG: transposase [Burkholderiales bacterium]|nr:transposase [Burkholderiales bacterium]
MPWKECHKVDEKLKFVSRYLDGEKIAVLCREFGISRVTGHSIIDRYRQCGVQAFTDRSRRPYRQANQLPFQIEKLILQIKKERPHWGAPKIRERLIVQYPTIHHLPAKSTVHAVLARHGLVNSRKRRRYKAEGTGLGIATAANELWCTDYKGEFMMGNKKYCYPLTVTDFTTRFLIGCEGLESTKEQYAFSVFERLFKDYGLPWRIRSDNGVPFASPNALYGLSRLAVWWLRLGIQIERIKPGHPEQNGRHERMHLTLKKETTKPPGNNLLQQQGKFDHFVKEYNYERPHQGINMKCPGDLYKPSARPYRGLPELDYPLHDQTITVTACGRICLQSKKVNLSQVFAGQRVGVKEEDDKIWLVSFMNYDIGYFDLESCRVEPLENPFGPKVLSMSPV